MADKIPVKAIFTGADVTALGEFNPGDTIPVANGGTGATTAENALINLGIDTLLALPNFTATGGITIGKPVAINTDGTASQVAKTGTALLPDTAQTLTTGTTQGSLSIAWDETLTVGVAVYRLLTSNIPQAVAFSLTSNGFTMGTPVALTATAGSYGGAVTFLSSGKFLVAWHEAATTMHARVLNVTADRIITAATAYSVAVTSHGTHGSMKAAANTAGTQAVVVSSGSSQHSGVVVDVGGSDVLTLTATNALMASGTNNTLTYALVYEPVNDKYVWSAGLGGASAPYFNYLRPLSVSAGVISVGTSYSGTNNAFQNTGYGGAICALPGGYIAHLHCTGYGSNNCAVTLWSLTGTTMQIVDSIYLSSVPALHSNIAYNSVEKRIYLFGAITSTITGVSSTSIAYDETNHVITKGDLAFVQVFSGSISFTPHFSSGVFYSPSLNKFPIIFSPGTTSYPSLTWYQPVTTNAANFIGIAQATVANGASLQVKSIGQTDTNQSGLSTGKTYYVDSDGVLVLTPTAIKAGRALSATKLLIGV